jgi:hypothetical protein
VVLAAIEVSVVPVASKNTKNGDIPAVRTVLTFSVRGPLVAEQAGPFRSLVVRVGLTFGGALELVTPAACSQANKTVAGAHTSK